MKEAKGTYWCFVGRYTGMIPIGPYETKNEAIESIETRETNPQAYTVFKVDPVTRQWIGSEPTAFNVVQWVYYSAESEEVRK